MKEIKAYIKSHKLSEVTKALHEVENLTGVSVVQVKGFGRGRKKMILIKLVVIGFLMFRTSKLKSSVWMRWLTRSFRPSKKRRIRACVVMAKFIFHQWMKPFVLKPGNVGRSLSEQTGKNQTYGGGKWIEGARE